MDQHYHKSMDRGTAITVSLMGIFTAAVFALAVSDLHHRYVHRNDVPRDADGNVIEEDDDFVHSSSASLYTVER